jgi:hypothetical protein
MGGSHFEHETGHTMVRTVGTGLICVCEVHGLNLVRNNGSSDYRCFIQLFQMCDNNAK